MISIQKVDSKKLLKTFVTFPFELYKNDKNWVPPLIKSEMELFDPAINPVFKHAECTLFLAYRDNKVVGRMAAIINWQEVKEQHKSKMRFGWWDVIDDVEVSKTLLNEVFAIAQKNNLAHVEGPMGFSNLDKVGVVVEGFDDMGSMITWYNYPYYAEHLKTLGFETEKAYREAYFYMHNIVPAYFNKASSLIERRFKVQEKAFKSMKELMPYVDEMFDLFNQSYAHLPSFVAISEDEKKFYKDKYIAFINPDYVHFIFDEHNKMIAFSIVMPSFSEALQKSKGKLFPFGFWHFMQAKQKPKEVLFYLIGILPEYQNKGLTAIVFRYYYRLFKNLGVDKFIRTPELEENTAINNIWKHFDSKIYRRRQTFIKYL